MNLQDTLEFDYVNYKGELGRRKVKPIEIRFDKTPNTASKHWLLIAYDLEKNGERHFVIEHILKFYSKEGVSA